MSLDLADGNGIQVAKTDAGFINNLFGKNGDLLRMGIL